MWDLYPKWQKFIAVAVAEIDNSVLYPWQDKAGLALHGFKT